MKNQKKLVIGGFIILLAVVALGYAVFMGSGSYYYEVGEFLDKSPLITDKVTSINGEIADLTIDDIVYRFTLMDTTGRGLGLPVVYRGQVPNAFEAGRLAVIQGKLDDAGVFQATRIVTKCTSKN